MGQVETHAHFAQRVTKLGRKHKKMTMGYTTSVRPDGLIVARPRRRARNASGFRILIVGAALFFALKILMVAGLGPVTYSDRMEPLREGTLIEQAGAIAMTVDPLTALVAEKVAPYARSFFN